MYLARSKPFPPAAGGLGYRAQDEPLQRELWAHAVASAKEAPSPVVATFVTSLNETINLDAKRWNAMRSLSGMIFMSRNWRT